METNEYFSLKEYISKIKLSPQVLEHLEDVNLKFYNYLKRLFSYNKLSVVDYFIKSLYKELNKSNEIEHNLVEKKISYKDAFFDTLSISHARIHDLHKNFLDENSVPGDERYRTIPVKVSGVKDGKEIIYYWPPAPEQVPKFMDELIEYYKTSNNMNVYNNFIIKSALVQLFFIRIHPYRDGNGRTGRLLYNMKFTELVNKDFNLKLKICPLNISENILVNKITYCECIDKIKFNNIDDDNEAINQWLEFILNMIDEQLYYINNKIDENNDELEFCALHSDDDLECNSLYKEDLENKAKNMGIKKIK